jgi:hypothetical protein
MRHRSIATTMTYYEDQTADEVAESAWAAWERAGGDTFGDTRPPEAEGTKMARRVTGDGPKA